MYDDIRAAGAELVAISPQTVEFTAEVKRKWKLPFPVLSDAGNAYAAELGLAHTIPADLQKGYAGFDIDLPKFHGEAAWKLPLPARIVLDREGIVRSIEAHPDYTVRPEAEKTLEDLRSIS